MSTTTLKRLLMASLLVAAWLLPLLLTGCNEDDVEKSIGQQTAASVEKEYGVNTDPVLQRWATTLGHRLVGQSRRQNIPYSFKVVNTDMVNAFAAPYGYVYMTRGFLGFAESEDEIAFVLAHEIGHVTNRDSIKSFKQSILFNIGAALLGSQSEALGELGGIGAGLLMMHYSRGDEQDADVAGAMYSYAAGYDPQGGINFFERLHSELEKGANPSNLEHLFLTHPPTEGRIVATRNRPELNLNDAAVASHIGRSYARRSAFATAGKYYKLALAKKPEATTTRLAYAEALTRQGYYDRARGEYQGVLQGDPANSFAATGLQAMNQGRPPFLAATLADRQLAQSSLPLVDSANRETVGAISAAHGHTQQIARQLANTSGIVNGTISSLMEVSNREKKMSDRSTAAFVSANGAVSTAHDCAFTMESVNEDIVRVGDLLQANLPALTAALQQVASGEGMAGDAAAYARALAETQLGSAQIQDSALAARDAMTSVERASHRARTTAEAMARMVDSSTPDRYLYEVKTAASDARAEAKEAKETINQVKRMTAIAESRALLAKLNLATLGASPEIRQNYAGLVAYYCDAVPDSVTKLRAQGLGLGDAAFVLMAAHSQRAPVSGYVGVVSSNRVIDGLRQQGYHFQGPLALLRFLTNAVDREITARGQG